METAIPIALAPLASLQSTEASASQPASASCYRFTKDIGILAVIVTELKLSQVERQIFLTDVVEAAHDATLEEAPERFEIVGVNLAANIFALTVTDSFMREVFFQKAVTGVLIGRHQVNRLADGLAHEGVESDGVRVLNYLTDHVPLTADGSYHADFPAPLATTDVRLFVPMAVLVLAANESFINLDNTHKLAKIGIVHRSAKPHAHIPRCLVGTASDLPLNLKSADALLGIEHLPKNLEPSLERILGVLKDSSADDAEAVVFAWLAEPVKRARVEFVDGRVATLQATNDTVLPASFNQELLAGFVGWKGDHQFSERHHKQEYSRIGYESQQGYNRPGQGEVGWGLPDCL